MAALVILFLPELIVLTVVSLAVVVYLLLHFRGFARNTFGAATLLFVWAARAGFVGFIAYIAAWIFMFPVLVVLCGGVGLVRTWLEARAVREARKHAKLRS